jgi:hypothetical protein
MVPSSGPYGPYFEPLLDFMPEVSQTPSQTSSSVTCQTEWGGGEGTSPPQLSMPLHEMSNSVGAGTSCVIHADSFPPVLLEQPAGWMPRRGISSTNVPPTNQRSRFDSAKLRSALSEGRAHDLLFTNQQALPYLPHRASLVLRTPRDCVI